MKEKNKKFFCETEFKIKLKVKTTNATVQLVQT